MKTLQKIEKSKTVWIILFSVVAFFLLRLPSLIEPSWYGDEGIYQIIGMALNKGQLLYTQIWDNKPPLLYFIYALANSDQFTVRFLSLLTGLFAVIAFYFLTRLFFHSNKVINLLAAIFVFLIGSPLIEGNIANAENFMLLPIICTALLIYRLPELIKPSIHNLSPNNNLLRFLIPFTSGTLLGIAFLLKTVAFFDFAAFLCFIILTTLSDNTVAKKTFLPKLANISIVYSVGFILPTLLTTAYFSIKGNLMDFIHSAFFSNIGYVGYENYFLLPQGLLFLKILLLILALYIIFIKKEKLPQQALFIYIWFVFSLFNSFFSGRPWTHYLLVLLPSSTLILGLYFARKFKRLKTFSSIFLLITLFVAVFNFQITNATISKTFLYYQNFFLFITNQRSLEGYQAFFDPNTPRDYQLAQFITTSTKSTDSVFIWGNSPQIYALSNKLPPGKYTTAYHIIQNPGAINDTIKVLKNNKPRYIIVLPGTDEMPFAIGRYIHKFNLNNSTVYEITL